MANSSSSDIAPKLTDHEKARIRTEEMYRFEVRQSLVPAESWTTKTLTFLSKPFVILTLSAFVFSAVPYFYINHHETSKREYAHRASVNYLRLGLVACIDIAEASIQSIKERRATSGLLTSCNKILPEFPWIELMPLVSAYLRACPVDEVTRKSLYSAVSEAHEAERLPVSEVEKAVAIAENAFGQLRPLIQSIADNCNYDPKSSLVAGPFPGTPWIKRFLITHTYQAHPAQK